MKKFIKRIIWFFGFWTLEMTDELIYYLTTHTKVQWETIPFIIISATWIIPLIFMKDDKEE